MRRTLLTLPAALLALALPVAAAPAPYTATRVCRFADERIGESSGLAVSTRGDALWTHNDSGDVARFFAVDPRTCATTASYALDLPQVGAAGEYATSFDWEDMARATVDGTPVLLLADIGDNYQVRAAGVTVYEVAEPPVRTATPTTDVALPVRAVHQLVYPSGPHDAESLAALPDGRLLVVTKDRDVTGAYTGHSEVFVSGTVPLLTEVADLDVTALPGAFASDPDSIAISGADVTRDGSRLVVRTYRTAYVYDLRRGLAEARASGLLPSYEECQAYYAALRQ